MRRTLAERFWPKVNKHGPIHPILKTRCWEWVAGRNIGGYGVILFMQKPTVAHKVSWFLSKGALPVQLVLHRCDNRVCVNPDHLFEGTYQDNMDDAVQKNRTAVGERHGRRVLTDEDVLSMRKKYNSGELRQAELSRFYGVSQGTVSYVVNNKIWRHI